MDVHDLILLVSDFSFQLFAAAHKYHRNCLCRQGPWTVCYAPRWRLSRSTLEQDLPRLVFGFSTSNHAYFSLQSL